MSVFIGYPSFMAYQMMKGKKDNNDGFPSIPGMIARYSALGLTNEQMAANPVWADKTGNGYDLQLKNFSWKGMSGVGGYGDENHQTFYKFTLDDYVFIATPPGVKHMNFTFRVTGLQPGNKLTLAFFGTTNTVYGTWNKDGIYTVDADIVEAGKPTYFYNGYSATRGEFTIEILPLYPGFILGDGVDDFAVTEKELNFEDTYTVYTPVILLKYGGAISGKSSTKDFSLISDAQLKGVGFDSGNRWSGSIPVDLFEFALVVCKRDPETMHVKDLITGKAKQSNFKEFVPNPGKYFIWRNIGGKWSQVAIAGQIICNGHFSTDEEDEKVLDWYKKQYPWLFPDQAWTVVGKTNEDEDRATIANITGNGNDLILSNFGFIEGSGYNEEGEYAGYLVTDGVDDKIISSNFKFGENYTVVGEWKFLQEASNVSAGFVKNPHYWILYNYKDGINAYIKADAQGSLISGVRSIKASTSKGDIYPDFNSYVKIEPGKRIESQYALNIAVNSSIFTKLAFKNLAIYPTVLSKDDCIKAYNYLQTLKAK